MPEVEEHRQTNTEATSRRDNQETHKSIEHGKAGTTQKEDVLPQIKSAKFITYCLHRKGLLPLFTSQIRFKFGSKSPRLRDKVDTPKEKTGSYTRRVKRKKYEEIVPEVTQQKVRFLADKPVDDVWISTYYPEPNYSLAEIIERHKEYAQPAMFNTLHSRIYADMDINMKTKKQTKFLQYVKNTLVPPYPFDTGVKKNVLVLCERKEEIALALELGAHRAGGAELIKLIKDGVIKKTDFDHLLATPDMVKDIMPLRGILREELPDARKGKVSDDLEKMVNFYVRGITFDATKVNDSLGKMQVPFGTLDMAVECLEENFNVIIDAINKHKPAGAPGQFISNLTIIAPPSSERYILQHSDYAPNRHKMKDAAAAIDEESESDSDEEEVKKSAKNR